MDRIGYIDVSTPQSPPPPSVHGRTLWVIAAPLFLASYPLPVIEGELATAGAAVRRLVAPVARQAPTKRVDNPAPIAMVALVRA